MIYIKYFMRYWWRRLIGKNNIMPFKELRGRFKGKFDIGG